MKALIKILASLTVLGALAGSPVNAEPNSPAVVEKEYEQWQVDYVVKGAVKDAVEEANKRWEIGSFVGIMAGVGLGLGAGYSIGRRR